MHEARVEWRCLSLAASPDGGPLGHELAAWDHDAPFLRWIDGWLAGKEAACVSDEWDDAVAELVPVHWIPYEHPGSVHPGASTSVQERCDPGPAERRSAAELDGWPAIEGHQRRNAGWALRHGGNARMGAGLEVGGATDDERRISYRIGHCGERLVFRAPDCECDPHARPSLVGANLCTHRMCHHCARLRSRKLAGRVRDRVGELRDGGIARYALLTLTYRDSASLEGCIDHCWRDFRKLRDRRLWEPVLGSVATIEIKRGERSGLWHPHLHVLVARPSCWCLRGRHPYDDGPLCVHGRVCCPHALNQCCLVDAWREITGDSYVVDIRAVRADSEGDMGGAIREVVKYCTKLTEADSAEGEDGLSDVLELHRAIRGRRLLVTTGVFRGLKEPESAEELLEDPESRPCAFCGTPWVTVTAAWDEVMGRYAVRRSPWERDQAPSPRPPARAAPGPLPGELPCQAAGSGEGVTDG